MTGPLARAYAARRPRSDKGTRHSYIDVYETLFAPYRRKRTRVLEIGVKGGHSLGLWADYFTSGQVTGIDIRPVPDPPAGCTVILGDATRPEILDALGSAYDIVIDDGSHRLRDQIATFELLCPRLAPGGIYVIEDIQSDADRDAIQAATRGAFEVLDRRAVKGRYDDVLMIHRG